MKTGIFKRIITAVFFLVPFWFLFLSAGIVLFVSNTSYIEIQHWFSSRWPDAYDASVFFEQNFTKLQYELLNRYSSPILIFFAAIILLLIWYRKTLWHFFESLFDDIVSVFRFFTKTFTVLSTTQKWSLGILFLLLLGYRIYFFLEHTMHTDETASYLFFTRQGLLHSSINYVSTNNHVFFNIIGSVINTVFSFLPPKLIIRLPSLLADLFLWYGMFCIVNKFSSFRRAFFIVAGTCFCYILSYYAVQGRGYKMQELFVVISLFSFWIYFIANPSSRKGFSLMIVSLVLGSYTNPLFVYHLLAVLLLGTYITFVLKKIETEVLMKTFIVLASATILVYMPVLLVNGIHGFVENRNAPTQTWQNLLDKIPFLIGVVNYNFSIGKAGVFVLLVGSVLFSYLILSKKLNKPFYHFAFYYFASLVLAIVFITLYKKVYPPERGMSFFVLLANLVFLSTVYDVLSRANGQVMLWGFLLCKVAVCVRPLYLDRYAIRHQRAVQIPKDIYRDLDELTELNISSWQMTAPNDYYFMYTRLYLTEHHRNDNIIFNRGEAKGDVIFVPERLLTSLNLSGYHLWKGGRLTALSDSTYSLSIYVANRLK